MQQNICSNQEYIYLVHSRKILFTQPNSSLKTTDRFCWMNKFCFFEGGNIFQNFSDMLKLFEISQGFLITFKI